MPCDRPRPPVFECDFCGCCFEISGEVRCPQCGLSKAHPVDREEADAPVFAADLPFT